MAQQEYAVTFEWVDMERLTLLYLLSWVTFEAMYRLGAAHGETRGDWLARTKTWPDVRIGEGVLRAHLRVAGEAV